MPLPADSKTTQRVDKPKKAPDSLCRALPKVLRSFLLEVEIKLTRDKKGEMFPNAGYFHRNPTIVP